MTGLDVVPVQQVEAALMWLAGHPEALESHQSRYVLELAHALGMAGGAS